MVLSRRAKLRLGASAFIGIIVYLSLLSRRQQESLSHLKEIKSILERTKIIQKEINSALERTKKTQHISSLEVMQSQESPSSTERIEIGLQDNNITTINAARLHQLESACKHYGATPLPEKLSVRLVVDDLHHAINCQVLKSGSTTMVELMGRIVKDQRKGVPLNIESQLRSNGRLKGFIKFGINRLIYQKSSFEAKKRKLDDYFTFIIVRHPLVRLASGFYQRLAGSPTAQTRGEVAGIISHLQGLRPSDVKKQHLTFEDFARYVSQPDTELTLAGDTHFWTVSYSCFPCAIQYDYVAKLETFNDDMAHILPHFNTTIQRHPIPHKNTNHGHHQDYEASYRKLPTDVLNNLLNKYRVDFDLFGYTLGEFFSQKTLDELEARGVNLF